VLRTSACIVAWDNMVLEMHNKGVRPTNGLFLGQTTVGSKKQDCPTEYNVRDTHDHKHTQCNCVIIVTKKEVDKQAKLELEANTGFVDLFQD
jgi:hypothetical protein